MPDVDRVVKVASFGLITDPAGRVLLVRQNYGHYWWGMPGGMAMPGESLVDTARREVLEETGLEVELSDLVALDDRGTLLVVAFRGHTDRTDTTPDPAEVAECRWFTPPELDTIADQTFASPFNSHGPAPRPSPGCQPSSSPMLASTTSPTPQADDQQPLTSEQQIHRIRRPR